MAKFVVDRQSWYRGHNSNESKLLRQDGTRCCIGFVGQQCGIADKDLLEVSSVATLNNGPYHSETHDKFPAWMRASFGVIKDAYMVNDKVDMTDAQREKELQIIFSRFGDEIEFIN